MEKFNPTEIDPFGHDRLAHFLFPGKWPRLLLAEATFLILAAAPVVAAIAFGVFKNPSLKLDAQGDIGYWNHIIAGSGMILATGIWQERLVQVIKELRQLGVVSMTAEKFTEFVESSNQIYGNLWLAILPYVIAFLVTLGTGLSYHLSDAFWHSYTKSWQTLTCGILQVIPCFLTYFVCVYVIMKLIATYLVLRNLFEGKLKLDPLHPDGCAGLEPLGSLSMRLNIIVFIFGVITVIGLMFNIREYEFAIHHPMNILLLVTYGIASVVVFFLPLYAAREKMNEARMNALVEISSVARTITENIKATIAIGNAPAELQMEKLERTEAIHRRVNQMPIYPFNTRIVVSFFASLISPVVLMILGRLIDKFL